MPKNNRKAAAARYSVAPKFAASTLATAITLASGNVLGLNFQFDDVSVDFDSTITYGVQWRMQNPDDKIRFGSKGGSGASDGTMDNLPKLIDNAFVLNGNDGNNSFDKGDMTANRISYLADIDFNFGDFGVFTRFKAYYDQVYDNNDSYMEDDAYAQFNTNTKFGGRYPASQGHYNPKAREYMKSDAKFLDFFIYGTFELGERVIDLRVGRQVISWGESMLSGGGISMAQNHLDTQIRNTPGLEIKEMFLPNGAIFAQFDLTETLNVQAYYQYEWQPSIMDPSGSYNSEMDSIGDGGEFFIFVSGDEEYALGKNVGNPNGADYAPELVKFLPKATYDDPNTTLDDRCVPDSIDGKVKCGYLTPHKLAEYEPSDSGQYGLSFQFVMEDGDELGFYFVNYHDKLPSFILPLESVDKYAPLVNMLLDPASAVIPGREPVFEGPADLGANLTTPQIVLLLNFLGALPEEGGTIKQILDNMGQPEGPGTIDYADPATQAAADLVLQSQGESLNSFVDSLNYRLKYFDDIRLWGMSYSTIVGTANVAGEITYRENAPIMRGDVVRTPDREEVWHMHLNTIMAFEPSFMWDFASLVAEVVAWHIPGRENFSQYDMADVDRSKNRLAVQNTANGSGIGALFMMEYRNVWSGVDLVVPLYASYGLDGAMFFTGYRNHQATVSVGLTAKYLDSMETGISYATNFGEKDDIFQTMTHDRDNLSINFKYGF
jgi:hypothetical protein